MGLVRNIRGAVLVIAAGVAVAKAAQARGGAQVTPVSPPEPVGSVDPATAPEWHRPVGFAAVEDPPVEEPSVGPPPVEEPPVGPPPVEEPPVEEPPVEEPPVEEPPVEEPPVEAPTEELPLHEGAEEREPPTSITDIVDDLLAPDRDRGARIEDATVVDGSSGGDPQRPERT